MEDVVLIGFGGHAKSVVDTIEQQGKFHIVGFVDIDQENKKAYRGYRVIGNDDNLYEIYESGVKNAVVTIGYMGHGDIRKKIYMKLKQIGFNLPNIIDNTAVIASDASIDEGTFIGKGAVINSNTHIGKMCIINTNAVVEHDCNIDEYTHVAVGAVICGGTKIGKSTLVGANATIIQMLEIGDKVIVGAGTVVLKDIPNYKKALGVWK